MKLKKVMSGTIALAMCSMFSLGLTAISAADVQPQANTVFISVEDVAVKADKTFVANVSLENLTANDLVGVDFAVQYDSTKVTIASVTEGPISKTGATEAELGIVGTQTEYSCFNSNIGTDQISILWMTGLLDKPETWIKDDGVFFTISGTVKDGASGSTSLEIVPVKRTVNGVQNTKIGLAAYANSQLITLNNSIKNGTISLSASSVVYGDLNGDGKVDNTDLVTMCRALIKDITLTSEQSKAADIVPSGEVDVADLALLKQYILGDKIGRAHV